jgi:hypothetical protein
MEEDAYVRIDRSEVRKQLTLTVEVPDWLPFHYPMRLRAQTNDSLIDTVKVTHPGRFKIRIPLNHARAVQLRSEQWAVAANGSDSRRLSYRLLEAAVEEPASAETESDTAANQQSSSR